MLTALVAGVTLLIGVALGYFSRETKDALRRIELALKVLVNRQKQEEAQEIAKKKGMSFGAPMSMAELADMEDEERIDALNAQM